MRIVRRALGWATALAILGALTLLLWALARGRPQDLPWTPLDLGEPIGVMTGRKLAGLSRDGAACRTLLDRAGIRYTALPPRNQGAQCGFADGVRFTRGGPRQIGLQPADVGVSCPVAATLSMWEWDVVQPAAQQVYGSRVVAIDHFGSYNCRRIYGRDSGTWSEHATANAFDVAGFRLANGRRITVIGDWGSVDEGTGGDASSDNVTLEQSETDDARFLHRVRDGACRLFSTVLSPDYNAAHRDHLHLDQAGRGALGGRACR